MPGTLGKSATQRAHFPQEGVRKGVGGQQGQGRAEKEGERKERGGGGAERSSVISDGLGGDTRETPSSSASPAGGAGEATA